MDTIDRLEVLDRPGAVDHWLAEGWLSADAAAALRDAASHQDVP